jgi:phosphatidylglycerol:prolipoprotein diacylglycerol transferase
VQQTLFHIPHELGGWPVFGFGWALLAWALFSAVLLICLVRRQGFNADTRAYLPVLALVALAICFVLPLLEERYTLASGEEVILGVPIRGYGTLLLIGVVAGLGLAVDRARRVGLDPEIIYSLAFWMFLWSIVGARAFYVIQKWDMFAPAGDLAVVDKLISTAGAILNFTQGGLVVYGALIGALVSGCVLLRRQDLPILALGDLIAPSLVLGLAIGRLGCLMNGCCYGGVCQLPWAISFPRHSAPNTISPPYEHQHRLGLLHGIRVAPDEHGRPVVAHIRDDQGPAARAGLNVGERIESINGQQVQTMQDAMFALAQAGPRLQMRTGDGDLVAWSVGTLPARSLRVSPTQIYASLNAAVIFLFLFAYYPFRKRDGEVIALLLTIYPVTRFLLEIVRTDEGAILAAMTISQNVSLLLLVFAAGLWVYLLRRPPGRALPGQPAAP